jgi:acyl dehydratase
MPDVCYEDLPVGFSSRSAVAYQVTEEEIIEFGRRFDPRPFHTDPQLASDLVFDGLVAPGCLVFAIRSALLNRLPLRPAYLAGLGLENMDLPKAVRPGDQLSLRIECLARRESTSRANAGIMRFGNTLFNQRDEIVMTLTAIVLVAKRRVSELKS